VRLMTHSGNVVALHHDLRVPFARYVVSNGLTSIKRFSIEKVLRERKVFGFHPREFYECAFDVISSGQGIHIFLKSCAYTNHFLQVFFIYLFS